MGCTLAGSEKEIGIIREAAGQRFDELEIKYLPLVLGEGHGPSPPRRA